MNDESVSRASLTVLLSLRPPDGKTTQFVDLMVEGAADDVKYRFFSWREALTGHYDVLHVHWPELMIRDSRSKLAAFVKRRLLDLLIARLRVRRIPIVRTFHNPRPHEKGKRAEERALDRFDRATTLFLALTDQTTPTGEAEWTLVPHPHYAVNHSKYPWPHAIPGRVTYFGIIRPYKNVDALIAAFRRIADPEVSLEVVGNPHPGQEEIVRAAAGDDPRVDLILKYVDDDELVRAVRESSLVILPYREMHNSGALLVAASLGRPALVPSTPVNQALAAEIGSEWVRMYEGDINADLIERHLRDVMQSGILDGTGPDLSLREPLAIGLLQEAAYRRAIAMVTGVDDSVVTNA